MKEQESIEQFNPNENKAPFEEALKSVLRKAADIGNKLSKDAELIINEAI